MPRVAAAPAGCEAPKGSEKESKAQLNGYYQPQLKRMWASASPAISTDLLMMQAPLHACCVPGCEAYRARKSVNSDRPQETMRALMSKSCQVLALIALLAVPAPGSAQVTTAIFHSSRRPTPQEAKRRADSLRRADSVATATSVQAMHRWVDSAGRSIGAGSHHSDDSLPREVNPPGAFNDTAAADLLSEPRITHQLRGRSTGRTVEFVDGALAPHTSTLLPALMAGGIVALGLGIALLLVGRRAASDHPTSRL